MLAQPKLYTSEWREVFLLLAGVLYRHGRHRAVNRMVAAVLDALPASASLEDKARTAGLLGSAVHDLAPYEYQPDDARYHALLEDVMGIFDAGQSTAVPIKVAIAAAEALGQAGDPRFTLQACRDHWVSIPAGEFWMGAQKDDPSKPNHDLRAYDDESPVHKVSLSAYRIGRYPVTVGEYQRFMDAGGYEEPGHWESGGFGDFQQPGDWEEQRAHPTRPVVGVSWYEACAYAAWAGAQLPTEAQWERAARGTSARKFPWGDQDASSSLLNFEMNVGAPTPVGVYPRGATPDGICDLAGNVWEWCLDGLRPYSNERQPKGSMALLDPVGPTVAGSSRVLRGGGWDFFADGCRSADRVASGPIERRDYGGFRLCVVD